MSEELNPKQLPHEMLMSRYGLSMEQMGQSKIETYDRYICDGIFEYLEAQETITSDTADTLEKQADDKREEVKDKMEEMHEEAKEESNEPPPSENKTDETQSNEPPAKPNSDEDENKVRIGFWDWK